MQAMPPTDPPLSDAFRAFAASVCAPVDGALLVSRIVRPATDEAWCRAELARLSEAASPEPAALVASLREAGFGGAQDYYARDNSALDYVLRERRGIPITLAMVVIGTAEPLGITATGINFPGHFMVALNGEPYDPFAMAPLDAAAQTEWLGRAGVDADAAFRPAGGREVVLRMLNNLKGLALAEGDSANALELSSYQLIVASDALPIHVERAELWRNLGALDQARVEIEAALGLAKDATLRARLETWLERLAAARPTLH